MREAPAKVVSCAKTARAVFLLFEKVKPTQKKGKAKERSSKQAEQSPDVLTTYHSKCGFHWATAVRPNVSQQVWQVDVRPEPPELWKGKKPSRPKRHHAFWVWLAFSITSSSKRSNPLTLQSQSLSNEGRVGTVKNMTTGKMLEKRFFEHLFFVPDEARSVAFFS